MWGIWKMGKEYKDYKLEDIPKLKKGAIIAGLIIGVIAIIWSAISMGKKTSISLELEVGETIDVGSVRLEFDEDGNVEGSNEHVICSANKDPKDPQGYILKITGKSEGKATIKVTSVYQGESTTYKYKIKVVEK